MSESVLRPRSLVLVFAALIGLTIVTVGASYLDLGAWHATVGLAIAVAKAVLIGLFFMHVWQSRRFTWVVAVAGVFWLGLLMGLTLTDVLTRGYYF